MCIKSLEIQPSSIGYIAMAVALLGQGDQEGALRTFDLAFHDCEVQDNRFLLLLKSILVFESGNQEDAIIRVEHLVTRANNDHDDEAAYLHTQARSSRDAVVLGAMYMKKGKYGRAIPLIEHAKNLVSKDTRCPYLEMISLFFGWNISGMDIIAQQRLCETLYAEERTTEAVEILLNIIRTSDEDVRGSKETSDWITDFTKKCATRLEDVGDEVPRSVEHDNGLPQYSTALSLGPPSPAGLLIKWSRDRAGKGLWEDALQYANDAVKVDPSCPWGYGAKHVALHGAKRYEEAVDAFKTMLHTTEQCKDSAIRQLRKDYISPSETIAAIERIVREILKNCPLVVINVTTGCLCDGTARTRIFKTDQSFFELVSSMTREVDSERIQRVVASFFGYVMFSHAWQGNEPLFQDVNAVESVWNLPDTPLNQKLRSFCEETRRLGHNWAWSDTCCIDKSTSSILNQSLTSMYKWYADSAATLVFLAGIVHPTKPGDLTRSLWMTRAWTLQELLAPKVVFFYDSEWQPYLSVTGRNHKESPVIMQELADAINIPRGTMARFLQMILVPHYGEGADALGHLLEEIVTRSGEVTVLAWSGKSSSYNSCLPASISIYSQTPFNPLPIGGEEMETCVTVLRGKLSKEEALRIYKRINSLPAPRFVVRRLHLPCIVFPVRGLSIQGLHKSIEKLYLAEIPGLGNVEFITADDLPLHKRQKFVFAHPWISYIRGPSSGPAWADDPESDTDFDSGSDSDAGSDGVVLLHAPQVGRHAKALQMLARLGQPFNALLLVQQPNREYRRVAAENEIIISGLGTNITSKNVRAQVLEIL
ncbi:hypothetical protein EDC04DRAFT_2598785 [Pisolithus marmoratus]|nr:hypothetical protein EDC04DRAFT_2598785 [Pisolithus marmoratus]